jgi:hypothetical protein
MAARTPAPKARWLLPVVLVVMIVTAAGAVVARTLYTAPAEANATRPLAVPNGRVLPPAEQPGDATVKATEDAAAHPLYESVRQLLQANFDAINTKNYGLWQSVVSDARAKSQPKDAWLKAYRSTVDGSIVVQRIEVGPVDTARVMLSFTSVQDPADAPTELPEPCIHWQVVFPLGVEHGIWKLKSGTTAQAPQLQKC